MTTEGSLKTHAFEIRVRAIVFAAIVGMLFLGISPLGVQGNNGIGGAQGDARSPYAIGLWGDLPYSAVQEVVGVESHRRHEQSRARLYRSRRRFKTGFQQPLRRASVHAVSWLFQLIGVAGNLHARR